MSQGPDLPQPIYPGGQPPASDEPAAEQPAPATPAADPPVPEQPAAAPTPAPEAPAAETAAEPTPPAPPAATPRSAPTGGSDGTAGSGGGGRSGVKLAAIAVAAVVVIAGAGFALSKVLGGSDDPDSKDRTSAGGDASAEATEVAGEALSSFPQAAQDCMAAELDDQPELLEELGQVSSNAAGFRMPDSALASQYADTMAGCVTAEEVADSLAGSTSGEQADCVRENASAWSHDEMRDFIETSVDPDAVTEHGEKVSALLTC